MARRPLLLAGLLTLLLAAAAGSSASVPGTGLRPLAGSAPTTVSLLAPYAGEQLDGTVPSPASILGFEPGTRHARHDELLRYFEALAAAGHLHLERHGSTHEGRPLVTATFASPDRLGSLEQVRTRHLEGIRTGRKPAGDEPVVAWLAFSVHGNEASAGNAALLAAWWLAASPEARRLLDHAVVIVDPCLNPDGFDRFATWANAHRAAAPVANPDSREHVEAWPGGRTNHYWFDLNRDYLALTQPESRARMRAFHAWQPNVYGDWHEMEGRQTFFFQPGIPGRSHPLIPDATTDLTREFARRHAADLDARGSLFYTQERFDDFFAGKGSTYPDLIGTIGILFEQASARGIVTEGAHGDLTFAAAIANQFTTARSTLRAAVELRGRLLDHQRTFATEARAAARAAGTGGWLFGAADGTDRAHALASLLRTHGITVLPIARELVRDGTTFSPGSAFWVPADQGRTRLAAAALERRTSFASPIFYDISAWSLPVAYGLDVVDVPLGDAASVGQAAGGDAAAPARAPLPEIDATAVGWAFEPGQLGSPALLEAVLAAGGTVRVTRAPATFRATPGPGRPETVTLAPGSAILPRGVQPAGALDRILDTLRSGSTTLGVPVLSLGSGLAGSGPDLGGPSIPPLTRRRIAIAVGDGVTAGSAGDLWHLFDQRVGAPVALIDLPRLPRTRLEELTTLILPDGSGYGRLDATFASGLRRWIEAGGTLVAFGRAASWAAGIDLLPLKVVGAADLPRTAPASFADWPRASTQHGIAGSIFPIDLDRTHPLAFGIGSSVRAAFRGDAPVLASPADLRWKVAAYGRTPVAGYVSPEMAAALDGTSAVAAAKIGRGTVVGFTIDPAFRAFWHGTERLAINAVYFAPLVEFSGGGD